MHAILKILLHQSDFFFFLLYPYDVFTSINFLSIIACMSVAGLPLLRSIQIPCESTRDLITSANTHCRLFMHVSGNDITWKSGEASPRVSSTNLTTATHKLL